MARKRALQPNYQDRQKGNFQGKGLLQHQQTKPSLKNSMPNKQLSKTFGNGPATGDDEIETISEDDLPLEDAPEDGELSEIR